MTQNLGQIQNQMEVERRERTEKPELPVDNIVMPVKKIWEIVKEIEEHEQNHISDIGECKATLVINYGELGRCRPGLLKKETGRLMPMLLDVLEWYEKKLNEYEKA